ncbi:hypothetical protein [Bradyrhizobium sp. dw_411]|uniref:hypothetical protein n=1 Tax=Bradyrhizobium sp. dw_411 TaxID=2720082 RepID=UPI001BD0A914|nr:hypothetical protein [Bradyrhizobium sp. dw_411]
MTATAVSALMPCRAEAQVSLPEITVYGPPPKSGAHTDQPGSGGGNPGGDSKGEGNHAFDRLNQQLKRKVDETNPSVNSPPLDARSPDTKIGVINIPGVQQQYGKNFGHSVVPYRPPPLVYTSPLGPRR